MYSPAMARPAKPNESRSHLEDDLAEASMGDGIPSLRRDAERRAFLFIHSVPHQCKARSRSAYAAGKRFSVGWFGPRARHRPSKPKGPPGEDSAQAQEPRRKRQAMH